MTFRSIERDLASESSPFKKKKTSLDEGKLSPEKRSPLPPRSEKARPERVIKNIVEDDDEMDSVQLLIPSSNEAEPPTIIDHAER